MKNLEPVALEVCECCYVTEATGETCECGCDALSDLPAEYDSLTSGWVTEAYESRGETPPDWENGEDDSLGFSWGTCDACGSTLGGDRYPMTVWVEA